MNRSFDYDANTSGILKFGYPNLLNHHLSD